MNEDMPLNQSTDAVSDEAKQIAEAREATEPTPSAGAQLRSVREARGWTIGQVANQLNLAPRQIDALEHDNYAALPGMVIVRGFIRTYAKLLQVDATPILAAVQAEAGTSHVLPPARSAMSASFSETQLLTEKRGFPVRKSLVWALVLLIAGAVVYEGQRLGWKMQRSAPDAAVNEDAMPVTEETVPAKQNAVPVAAETVAPSSEANAAKSQPVKVAQPADVSQTSAAAAPAEEKSTSTAPASSKNVLAVRVRQDSWVEIRRADDTVLFSALLKSGAAESFDLSGPVSVVIGNAAGVDLTLRGAPVDIKGNASNVARLNLK